MSLRRAAFAAACLFTASCGNVTKPVNATAFELEIIWLGTLPSDEVRATFDVASDLIRQAIVGPLTAVAVPPSFRNLSDCQVPGYPDISRAVIRGLRVYAVVETIDGPGKTLGSAGPCLIRANDIPALGVMRFDEADVQTLLGNGRLSRVVLHEMLHVVGFGTVWVDQGLLNRADTSDARYTGLQARIACQADNGGDEVCATDIPVHSGGGDGSRFSHWSESVFGTELMTPILDTWISQFSATTIGSLEDLGYEVDYGVADAFTLPEASTLMAAPAGPVVRLGEPMRPRWKLDGAGRLTPYRPRP